MQSSSRTELSRPSSQHRPLLHHGALCHPQAWPSTRPTLFRQLCQSPSRSLLNLDPRQQASATLVGGVSLSLLRSTPANSMSAAPTAARLPSLWCPTLPRRLLLPPLLQSNPRRTHGMTTATPCLQLILPPMSTTIWRFPSLLPRPLMDH